MSFSFDSFLNKGKREKGKFSIKNKTKSTYLGKIKNEGTPQERALRNLEIELRSYNFESENKPKDYAKEFKHMEMIEFVNIVYFAAALYLLKEYGNHFADNTIESILNGEKNIFNIPVWRNKILDKLPKNPNENDTIC